MIRIGVIGCGDIAVTAHFPALERSNRVALTAISTRNQNRLEALKRQYSVPFATTDYHELLDREDVDAVIVATPPWATPEITIAALENGKDVLCEKPVAMTIEKARAMQETADRAGRKLMVGMTYHHDPILHKMREWVQGGRLGSPVMLRASIYDELWDPEENPEHYRRIMDTLAHGSPSVHEGAHIFDWLHVINGAEVRKLTSYGFKTRPEFPTSNYDITILDYANGDRAKVEIAWFLPQFPDIDFEAVGPGGIARMSSHKRFAQLKTKEETETFEDPKGWWEHCFDLQVSRFADLVENDGPCSPGIRDAVYTMRVTDALRKSMETGEPVVFADEEGGKL